MSEPESKRARVLETGLRSDISQEDVIEKIKTFWNLKTSSDLNINDVEITHYPFTVCTVHNFINNPELLKLVTAERANIPLYNKSNDLYYLQQSDDLKNLKNFTYISQLHDLIKIEGLNWMRKIFGDDKFKDEISATLSSYTCGCRLLCHDDKCEDRHIAFILYLNDNWAEDDGGALQLFCSDSDHYPSHVVKEIFPQFNTMVFFEVTHQSFHQVSEVISLSKERLTVNGWFHSSEPKLSESKCKTLEIKKTFASDHDFHLEEYFLPLYLENFNLFNIRSKFVAESEIQLQEFLVPEFWEEVQKDLKNSNIQWNFIGPANIRKYEIADPVSLPPALKTLKEIFESKCWFKFIKSISGVDVIPSETSNIEIWEKGNLPFCHFEIQRWTHSCYTLIHDKDPEFHSEALDVILRVPLEQVENINEDEDEPLGGHIIYIDAESNDEDECLLYISYKMNSLALVYRDTKTLRYTKYLDLNSKSFYQIFCTYRPWTPPADQPGLKHCEDDNESELLGGNILEGENSFPN